MVVAVLPKALVAALATELAALLTELSSLSRLLFADPVAVEATDCKLEIALDASDSKELAASPAYEVAVAMAPDAYELPSETALLMIEPTEASSLPRLNPALTLDV